MYRGACCMHLLNPNLSSFEILNISYPQYFNFMACIWGQKNTHVCFDGCAWNAWNNTRCILLLRPWVSSSCFMTEANIVMNLISWLAAGHQLTSRQMNTICASLLALNFVILARVAWKAIHRLQENCWRQSLGIVSWCRGHKCFWERWRF